MAKRNQNAGVYPRPDKGAEDAAKKTIEEKLESQGDEPDGHEGPEERDDGTPRKDAPEDPGPEAPREPTPEEIAEAAREQEREREEAKRKREEMRKRHNDLRANLERATTDAEWWDSVTSDPRFQRVLAKTAAGIEEIKNSVTSDPRFQRVLAKTAAGIEEIKNKLLDCPPKEVPTLQADVRARRAIVDTFRRDVFGQPVEEARNELKLFERENALFVSSFLRSEEKTKAKQG